MADFILEHWQLVATLVLALLNLVLTLAVHGISTARIKSKGTANPDDRVLAALSAVIEGNSAILEALNEKEGK